MYRNDVLHEEHMSRWVGRPLRLGTVVHPYTSATLPLVQFGPRQVYAFGSGNVWTPPHPPSPPTPGDPRRGAW